ncbi:coiled-coil domain-containing protein 102A-like isoform X2 [Clytia hemisphaerica]|uniref:coiled-coil domain-containing protein 102A-like isoform X2 n=1 Tax=Clytia hemisphaerica TaxID=252671 RepID=UPI0034D541CE
MSSSPEVLIQELEETREKALQFERTARWWNESCVKWREKWGKENAEKNRLIEKIENLNGRNRALIVEFQRVQCENAKLNSYIRQQEGFKKDIEQTVNRALNIPEDIKEVDEERRVARVEPIVEDIRLAKTMSNASPTTSIRSSTGKLSFSPLNEVQDTFEQISMLPSGESLDSIENVSEKRLDSFENISGKPLDSFDKVSGEPLDSFDDLIAPCAAEKRFYSTNESYPSLQDELTDLKRLIENLESTSSVDTQEEKSSMFGNLLEKVEGYFMECDNYVQESKRELEASRALNDIIKQTNKKKQDQPFSINHKETQTSGFQLPNLYSGAADLSAVLSSLSSIDSTGRNISFNSGLPSIGMMSVLSSCTSIESGDRCTSVDVVVRDLRENIQRLQEENSNEWSLREQTESELCSIKRELKQAEATIKSQEVGHEKMRTTQYESEVKKLRIKVEQLKKDLLTEQEKNDFQSNQLRRTQRTLEEQQQINETLQIQIDQTSTRLKYHQQRGSYNG